jgi:hypothetical protein
MFLIETKQWVPLCDLDLSPNAGQDEIVSVVLAATVDQITEYTEWRAELPLPGDASYKWTERLPVNTWPVNQVALKWLRAANDEISDWLPYLPQLICLGFERDLPVPGRGEDYRSDLELAAGELLGESVDSFQTVRWLLNNPNGPDLAEQTHTLEVLLEQAECWAEAAQSAMEWFYDRWSASRC